MNHRILAPLLAALLLASSAAAQDDPPYYQEQRLVVIFNVPDDLKVTSWDGSTTQFLSRGLYRFDATRKSQAILSDANLADGTGPFVQYGSSLSGQVSPLSGGSSRSATARLKVTDANLSSENILRAGELELGFRVQLSSMSSTEARYKAPVARAGSYVTGNLAPVYTSQSGQIEVLHVKLSLNDDHLPIAQPLDYFPEVIEAKVRNTPATDPDWGHEIEAGPYGFELTRDALNEAGQVSFTSAARFPMVNEWDYYGNYQSTPSAGAVVIKSNGDVWIRMGWGLSGRYHGWSFEMTATLSPAEFDQLKTQGSLIVSGKTSYQYGSEDYAVELETPAEFELTTASFPPTATTVTGRVRIQNGEVILRNQRRYEVTGMLSEALRALEGERVKTTGIVSDGPPRTIAVESFFTELRRDARGLGGGQVVRLSAGTEVEVLRTWSRYARVRYDDSGSDREVTIRLSSVVPTGAGGILAGVSTP